MSKLSTAWLNEKNGEIHSPKGRLVYPALLEAKVNRRFPNNPAKFNAILLIPKTANIDAMKAEIARQSAETHGTKWQTKNLKMPIKKTEDQEKLREFAAEYPWLLTASASEQFPPFVYDPKAQPYKGDGSDIYSGRWAVITGKAWGYTTGSNGIGWNLNRVQLLDHDEAIAGGRVATAEGFEAVDVGERETGAENTTDGLF